MKHVLIAVVVPLLLSVPFENAGGDERPSFSQDIQPIFTRSCTSCHGGVKQASDLSFVNAATVVPPEGYVVEPGKPEESELMRRILSEDPDERMPPPEDHPHPLSEGEIALIREWIRSGAEWEDHWSRRKLVAPRSSELDADARQWARTSLDLFVAEQHRHLGISAAPEADAAQWMRRTSFDLVGLPPSVEDLNRVRDSLGPRPDESSAEWDAWCEKQDSVYAAYVEQLLASERFGERWASVWLDLARYADSKGFEKDPHRDIWPYRDWLIQAFNDDMPYDEFTIKQLAGDLLPNPTPDDLIATAFHRNTQTNTEGGTDDEEYRLKAVIDRLNTTWTVWQATTFGCVQCHSHPYEPFKHQEYYKGLALFNNTEDCDLNDEYPTLPYLADDSQRERWLAFQQKVRRLEDQWDTLSHSIVSELQWKPMNITAVDSTSAQLEHDQHEVRIADGTVAVGSTFTLTAQEESIAALRFRILPESDDPRMWPEQGSVISQLQVAVVWAAAKDEPSSQTVPIDIELIIPDERSGPYLPADSLKPNADGFGGYPKLEKPRWMVATLKKRLDLKPSEQLQVKILQKASVTGGHSNHLRRFRVEVTSDDAKLRELNQDAFQSVSSELQAARNELEALKGSRVPIMRERRDSASRETRLFLRGNFLDKSDRVEPGLPAVVASSSAQPTNRLEFARWLVSSENSTSSRVWANRIWAELFGLGLVETLGDFGVSGARPTNPRLLDHLAYQLQYADRWGLKAFLKRVVLSATYRQDSRITAEQLAQDPKNRYMARGPRTRLSAEMIRDQALQVAGVLSSKIGGPSVMPPQPEGVWQQAYSNAKWVPAEGDDRYRRGIYTYWRRTSPYPGFIMFDAPVRDLCSPRRIVTNTPLQALVTMNSEVFTELAAILAEQAHSSANNPGKTIRHIFLGITSVEPTEADIAPLLKLHEKINAGRSTPHESIENVSEETDSEDARPLSALGLVALALLNSDKALTK